MAAGETSVQIVDGNSPLETLALRVLRRYGEGSPSTLDADTMLMFVDYGNMVLDDMMAHPYWEKGVSLPYYQHQQQVRSVPDQLLMAGLLAKYAIDKASSKAPRYEADYYMRLNQVLARVKFGVGAQFEMQAVDYGDPTATNPGVS
jgi:hypothetical protein